MITITATRPTSTQDQPGRGRHGHRCAQGFCTVCGSAWPCWRAESGDAQVVVARTTGLSRAIPAY